MAQVKGRTIPEIGDAGRRLRELLGLLSDFPSIPWGYRELAAMLREDGHELADATPKKWPQRGVPDRWGRPIAAASQKRGVMVTAEWLIEGAGAGPHRVDKTPPPAALRRGIGGPGGKGGGDVASGGAEANPAPAGIAVAVLPTLPGQRPAELEGRLTLVRHAVLGALDRALARDHELDKTREGYRILGRALMELAYDLRDNDVDTHELRDVAYELLRMGDR